MKRLFAVILTLCLVLGMLPAAQATMCAGEHTWGPWRQETEATCLRPGWQSRICTECGNGYDYREYPPALGHSPTRQVREEPTCTKPGYYVTVCSRCGQGLDNGGSIPALGHDYKRSVAQEATCTSDGMVVYTCSRCGDAYREPIPATGHKWGQWIVDTPSNCVQYGTRYHQCQRCGIKEWERNYADGLGDHDWGEWQEIQPATYVAPGIEERVCKIDSSHREQREIPFTGKVYTLLGLSVHYAGYTSYTYDGQEVYCMDSQNSGSASTETWEAGQQPADYGVNNLGFYTEAYSSFLHTPPMPGQTYYFTIGYFNHCEDGTQGIDFSKLTPDNVHVDMAGFDVQLMGIEIRDEDGIFAKDSGAGLRFAATYLGGAQEPVIDVWLDYNEKWLPEKYVIGSKIELDMYTVNDSNVPVTLTLTEITEHPVGDLIDPWPDINGAVIQPGDIYHWVLTIYINGADGMVGEAIRHIYQEFSYNDGTPALQSGQTNTIELHYLIEEEGPQYILKGATTDYSGWYMESDGTCYLNTDWNEILFWEVDPDKDICFTTTSHLYTDTGGSSPLTTEPIPGETYYYNVHVSEYPSKISDLGHIIDFTQVDPDKVSSSAAGFIVNLVGIEPHMSEGDAGSYVNLRFSATYVGGVKVGVSVVDAADAWELEGAHVQLIDSDENVVDEWDSTASVHMIQGLKPNEQYTLKETVAPEGYLIAPPVVFTVDDENKVTSTGSSDAGEDDLTVILIENKKTVVGVSKVDAKDGAALAGAYIQLLDSNGNVIDEWESTFEAHVIEGLKTNEEYTLIETVPPKGYMIAPASAFTIDDENHITSTGSSEAGNGELTVILIENSRIVAGVSVVDAADAWKLEGAHVQLFDSNGNVVDEWDSTTEIHVLQELKRNEQYTLEETVAPEGYLIASSVAFTIDDEDHVTTTGSSEVGDEAPTVILIENKKTAVGISKVDAEDGTVLEGAHIQIVDSDGNVIDEWESTSGVHVIEGLKTNEEYTLTETVPPEGYMTAPASAFTIDEENHITSTGSVEAGDENVPVLLIEDSRTTLLLEVVQTSPAKAVYELNDEIWLKITLTNTGEEPLNVPSYFYKWAYDNTTWSVYRDVTLAPGASEVFTDLVDIWQEDVDMGYMGLTFTGQAWQEDAENPEINKLSNNPGAVQSNTVELKWPTAESEETGSLLLEVSWAPDEGVGKVTGDPIRERFKLTNTGNTNVLVPARFLSSEYEDVVQPNWYLEFGGVTYTVLKPGWDMSWTYIDQVYQEDVDIGAVRWSTRVFGYVLIGEDQQGESVVSNWADIDIPLTGGTTAETPALTLTTYASPVKSSYPYAETYSECDVVKIDYVLTNTGKTPIYIRELENKWGDGFVSKYLLDILLYPGETFSDYTNVWLVTDVLTPNTDGPGIAGTVDVDFYAYGRDKDDYDAILCETAHCPYSFTMDAPGPTGWEIPSESIVWIFKSELSSSTLPEGYQKGEQIVYDITVINPSNVDVDDAVMTDAKLGVSEALPMLSGDETGVWIISKEYTYTVTEEDVSAGGIYNEAYVEWTDPDSMEKKGDLDWLLLYTTDKTSLLLKKEIVGGPKNGEYYVEGEEITFSVTAKNNTDMVLPQVFVNDALIEGDSQTLMDIPDMQPGDEMTQSFKYKVTGGDVGIGYITNTATSEYEDAKGGWNHITSNPVTAYTGKKKPIEDDTTPEPPTPPYPPVFGVNSDIEITKEQDNNPANHSYYVEGETIRYAITVKNTGEVPVDIEIYDSLAPGGGLIDTVTGLVPNASKKVYYEYKVTQPDVDATCVVNYALAKWHPQGIWAETVYMSNKVTSPTSERPAPDGHLTFSGTGDSCYREVTSVNEYGASYTLHLCAEHAAIEAATQVKQGKGITYDWQKAVAMWREAVDKEYEEYLDAAEGAARVVVINERLTYYLWLGSYEKQLNLLYPNDPDAVAQKIAESLMDRCADLCYGEHNPGKAPQDSLAGMRVISGQQAAENCGRIVTGRSGNEIYYDFVLDAKHAATEKNVLELIGEAEDGAARANAWTRGQQLWQMALDKEVNALYKAASKEDRQVIAMTRRFLDQLVTARTALIELMYSGDRVIVGEQIEQLYKEYAMILCGK